MILLDTDHLSVLLDERHASHAALVARLRAAHDIPALPIVSIEEQLRAWLAKVKRGSDPHRQVMPYLRLRKVFTFLRDWPIADWTEGAADRFALLRPLRLRIGSQDLRIACIALDNDALLLSANLRHFDQVPALHVEDQLN
jgi:tRNA(fMet)-specific endonuclease VapC